MNSEIRELNVNELDAVSGGCPLGAIVASVIAAAIYDKMKDCHGISDAIDYIKGQQK